MRHTILFLLFLAIFPIAIHGQDPNAFKKELAQVKRIYVDDDPYETPKEKAVKPLLQTELTKQGFVIAADKENAQPLNGCC